MAEARIPSRSGLECPVCLKRFTVDGDLCPHILTCAHTFCYMDIVILSKGGTNDFECPTCRRYISINDFEWLRNFGLIEGIRIIEDQRKKIESFTAKNTLQAKLLSSKEQLEVARSHSNYLKDHFASLVRDAEVKLQAHKKHFHDARLELKRQEEELKRREDEITSEMHSQFLKETESIKKLAASRSEILASVESLIEEIDSVIDSDEVEGPSIETANERLDGAAIMVSKLLEEFDASKYPCQHTEATDVAGTVELLLSSSVVDQERNSSREIKRTGDIEQAKDSKVAKVAASEPQQQPKDKRNQILCRFKGYCRNKKCPYLHPDLPGGGVGGNSDSAAGGGGAAGTAPSKPSSSLAAVKATGSSAAPSGAPAGAGAGATGAAASGATVAAADSAQKVVGPPYVCDPCGKRFPSGWHLEQHLTTKKHTDVIDSTKNQPAAMSVPSSAAAAAAAVRSTGSSVASAAPATAGVAVAGKESEKGFPCALCEVVCISEFQLKIHLRGKKHMLNLQSINKGASKMEKESNKATTQVTGARSPQSSLLSSSPSLTSSTQIKPSSSLTVAPLSLNTTEQQQAKFEPPQQQRGIPSAGLAGLGGLPELAARSASPNALPGFAAHMTRPVQPAHSAPPLVASPPTVAVGATTSFQAPADTTSTATATATAPSDVPPRGTSIGTFTAAEVAVSAPVAGPVARPEGGGGHSSPTGGASASASAPALSGSVATAAAAGAEAAAQSQQQQQQQRQGRLTAWQKFQQQQQQSLVDQSSVAGAESNVEKASFSASGSPGASSPTPGAGHIFSSGSNTATASGSGSSSAGSSIGAPDSSSALQSGVTASSPPASIQVQNGAGKENSVSPEENVGSSQAVTTGSAAAAAVATSAASEEAAMLAVARNAARNEAEQFGFSDMQQQQEQQYWQQEQQDESPAWASDNSSGAGHSGAVSVQALAGDGSGGQVTAYSRRGPSSGYSDSRSGGGGGGSGGGGSSSRRLCFHGINCWSNRCAFAHPPGWDPLKALQTQFDGGQGGGQGEGHYRAQNGGQYGGQYGGYNGYGGRAYY